MYPMYPLLSLKIPSFGLKISRISFRDPGLIVTRAREATNLAQPGGCSGSGVTPEPPWKVIKFHASLQGNKSHENWSQGHQKSWKNDPGIMINPISAKAVYCNTSLAKCLVFQSQTPRFRPKHDQKKQPGNRYEKTMFFNPNVPTNLFKWGP